MWGQGCKGTSQTAHIHSGPNARRKCCQNAWRRKHRRATWRPFSGAQLCGKRLLLMLCPERRAASISCDDLQTTHTFHQTLNGTVARCHPGWFVGRRSITRADRNTVEIRTRTVNVSTFPGRAEWKRKMTARAKQIKFLLWRCTSPLTRKYDSFSPKLRTGRAMLSGPLCCLHGSQWNDLSNPCVVKREAASGHQSSYCKLRPKPWARYTCSLDS